MTKGVLCSSARGFTDIDLIIGDFESLSLFGVSQQNQMRQFTRGILSTMIHQDSDAESTIAEVLDEIKNAEARLKKANSCRLKLFKKANEIATIEAYKNILSFTDRMTLVLQLQKAQLLKNKKTYEQMEQELMSCESALSKKITYGEEVLQEVESIKDPENSVYEWKCRLEKRLDDLQISHTVIMQNILQLNVLNTTSDNLLNQIATAISLTIPIWQTQISIALGLKKAEKLYDVKEKISRVSGKQDKETRKIINHSEKSHCFNKRAILEADDKLLNSLYVIQSACSDNRIAREEILTVAASGE